MVPASEHGISPDRIDRNVRQILARLDGAGFEAYLVGGCVRDLLLGRAPKDFDVATAARPDEVRALFPRSRLIGRRFRLAHVRAGREVFEVATFRAGHEAGAAGPGGMLLHDNVYGTREEDAVRRDFTVNALYYDDRDGSVLDFTGGMADLDAGRIRAIGDPAVRYREDPVRMLRAVRFAAKLGFRIEAQTQAPIFDLSPLLEGVPAARLFEEVLKLFQSGHARESLRGIDRFDLLPRLYPETAESVRRDPRGRALLERALVNTDRRIAENLPVSPGFLVAALMWGPVRDRAETFGEGDRARGRGGGPRGRGRRGARGPGETDQHAAPVQRHGPRHLDDAAAPREPPPAAGGTDHRPSPVPRRVRLPVPACGGRRASRGARGMVDRGPGGWRGSGSGG